MLHRYDPIREPRKEISHESMVETLKRKVREAVEKHAQVNGGSGEKAVIHQPPVPSADSGDSRGAVAPTPAISWLKPVRTSKDGLGYRKSECGRFVIAKVRLKDVFVYTASRVNHNWPATVLGSFSAASDAQACCEREASK
jgi:hypothetical protein